MAKKKSKPVEKIRLSGRNIYTDKKGRVIFYDMITKKGYLVDKKHENSALFFKNRFVVLLFAAILFGATFLTWLQAAVAWAVMMAIAEFAFRRGFLKKLEVVNDVDFERRVSALQYIVENKAKGKVIRLSGRNIYTDKKGRVIFYDMITKKGYLVDKKHENSALFFKNRFVVLLFAAILFGATFLTWLQAAVAWAVMMAIAEFAFRRGFLKKLEVVNDVDFERRVSALQYIVENKAKGKVIVLIVLYLLLAVLVILNAYVEKYSVGLCVLSGGIALVGVYFAILHIVALTKMK